MKRLLAAACLLPAAAFSAAFSAAFAQDTTRVQGVRIGLTYAPGTRPGVFIAPIAGTGADADSARTILARDLDFSDRLTVIAPDGGDAPAGALNYLLYAQLGAAAVVQASVTPTGSLHVAVHDVAGAKVITVVDVPLPSPALGAEWRRAVHGVSDEVERAITGERGIAGTRILFVRDETLWTVDSDGAVAVPVLGVGNARSPAWHPTGRFIAYQQFAENGHHTVAVRDFAGGPARHFTGRGFLNGAPTFSPDGRTLVFGSGEDGIDLYAADPFGTEAPRRLTVGRGTQSYQPTFRPDGQRIAYTSNLPGHPEVYITDADGTNADLLTSSGMGEQSYRSDPDWSPDGRKVAYQSMTNGGFQIMTINVRDQSVQALTSEGSNEEPSWAPDGRHLVFTSTRSGVKQLWVLDTESGRTRQLTRGARARMPSWSPRLDAAR